jgi:hypothetical protein
LSSFYSLDVEGSEFPILQTIPFDLTNKQVMSQLIADLDAVFVKKGYLDEINEL